MNKYLMLLTAVSVLAGLMPAQPALAQSYEALGRDYAAAVSDPTRLQPLAAQYPSNMPTTTAVYVFDLEKGPNDSNRVVISVDSTISIDIQAVRSMSSLGGRLNPGV